MGSRAQGVSPDPFPMGFRGLGVSHPPRSLNRNSISHIDSGLGPNLIRQPSGGMAFGGEPGTVSVYSSGPSTYL